MYKSKDDGNAHIRVIRDLILTIVSILLYFRLTAILDFKIAAIYIQIYF